MGRYYVEPEQGGKQEQKVFNITQDVIRKVKRKQEYKPDKLKGNVYKKKKKGKKGSDPFPGKKPIDPIALERHSKGEGVNTEKIKTKFKQKEQHRREQRIEFAEEQSARVEMLLQEEGGFLEGDKELLVVGAVRALLLEAGGQTEARRRRPMGRLPRQHLARRPRPPARRPRPAQHPQHP